MIRLVLLISLLWPAMAIAECTLSWIPSSTPQATQTLIYVTDSEEDLQSAQVALLVPSEVTSVTCAEAGVEVGKFVAVRASDGAGNLSKLSNIVKRINLDAIQIVIKHVVEITQ